MNRGDTLTIVLDYTVDGAPIEQGQFDEIEFSIGSKRYTLTGEDITWDESLGKYTLFIGQNDSFAIGNNSASYQVRFRKGTEVVSTDINRLAIGGTISTTII